MSPYLALITPLTGGGPGIDNTLPGGPVYPGNALPGAPGYPSQGLPGSPGHPSQGLPGSPGHPSQGLPVPPSGTLPVGAVGLILVWLAGQGWTWAPIGGTPDHPIILPPTSPGVPTQPIAGAPGTPTQPIAGPPPGKPTQPLPPTATPKF